MINMSAKEFDARFDEGEDLDSLVHKSEKITIEQLHAMVAPNKQVNHRVTLHLSSAINDRLQAKSKELNITTHDLIKVILAQKLGVL